MPTKLLFSNEIVISNFSSTFVLLSSILSLDFNDICNFWKHNCLQNWLKPLKKETFGAWKLQYRSQNSSTSLILLKNNNNGNVVHKYPCPSFEISESRSRGWSYYDPSTSRWRDSYDMKFSCLCGTWIQINHSIPKLTFQPKLNPLELCKTFYC